MTTDTLAARKALLVARSKLYRMQLRYEASALRARVARPSRWIGGALTIFSLGRTFLSLVRKRR